MTCLEAQALFSAEHDGETVSEAELAAASAHCEECAECSAFAAGIRWLDEAQVPAAPEGLVERILAAVAPLQEARENAIALAADEDEVAGLGLELPVPEEDPAPVDWLAESPTVPTPTIWSRFEWFQGPTRWASFGAIGALAATALIAFVVTGIGTPPKTADTTLTAGSTSAAPEASFGSAAQKAAPAASDGRVNAAPVQAPDLVLYKEFVYRPGALLADASGATPTIGTLTTAFASGSVRTAPVYRSPLTDGSIVVKGPDGLRVYAPVVRMRSSVRYQLTSGGPIERFGVWPILPTRFPVPSTADGTPSFVVAGTDADNVTIYAATGRPTSEGFAVAPGTPTTDPAGGNPNWTWWAPAPANP